MSKYQFNESGNNENTLTLKILFSFAVSVDIIWVSLLSYYLWKRRDYFPIKERSPFLTIATLICYLVYIDQVPWFYLLNFIKASDQYSQFLIQNVGLDSFLIILMAKGIRLYYAYNAEEQKKANSFFRSQKKILLFVFLLMLAILTIYLIILCIGLYCQCLSQKKIIKYFIIKKLIIIYLFVLLTLILCFLYRKIPRHFKFIEETIFVGVIFTFIFNYNYIMYYLSDITSIKNVVTQSSNLEYLILWIFFYLYSTGTVLIPLIHSMQYHLKQPPCLILDNFTYFLQVDIYNLFIIIQENLCIMPFFKFLKKLDENAQNELSVISNELNEKLSQPNSRKTTMKKSQTRQTEIYIHPFLRMIENQSSDQYENNIINHSISVIGGNIRSEWMSEEYLHLNLFSFYLDFIREEMIDVLDLSIAANLIEQYFIGTSISAYNLQQELSIRVQNTKKPSLDLKLNYTRFQLINEKSQSDFNQYIQYMLDTKSYDLIIQVVVDYFNISNEYFEYLYFNHFSKTKSYQTMKKQLIQNENICNNLFRYNMTYLQTPLDQFEMSQLLI